MLVTGDPSRSLSLATDSRPYGHISDHPFLGHGLFLNLEGRQLGLLLRKHSSKDKDMLKTTR